MSFRRKIASLALVGSTFFAACTTLHVEMDNVPNTPINSNCPRSGKPVAEDSLTEYRGHTVGFCNPHCRDDFAADPEACASDRAAFDAIIAKIEGA